MDLEWLKQPLDALPDPLPVPVWRAPARSPHEVEIRPPGSKSLTNRALLLAGLASGESVLRGALVEADDAKRMLAAIQRLGCGVEVSGDTVRVQGVGGRWRTGVTDTRGGGKGPDTSAELFLNNAGTATRFLAASCVLADGPITIDGNERMRQRPIGELVQAVRSMGVEVLEFGEPGCPPIRLDPRPAGTIEGINLSLGKTRSGQFVSALLMVGAFLHGGVTLRLTQGVTSGSYVRMTLGLLERLGATVKATGDFEVVRVLGRDLNTGRGLTGFELDVEPDASGATYWCGAAALLPGLDITVRGLDESSLQGDAGFAHELGRMGAGVEVGSERTRVLGVGPPRPIMTDMSDMPDAAMTLAAVAAFADGTSVFRGVHTLRDKECDRIDALRTELGKVGVRVTCPVNGDSSVMTIEPPAGGIDCSASAPTVDMHTYDDHRMAMSLALVGLRRPNVRIKDPGCVAKTYPGYWREWAALYA